MARKNIVNLTGIVRSDPKVITRGGVELVFFRMLVRRLNHIGVDEPIIEVFGDHIASVRDLKAGDSVHVEGEIRTREAKKRIECGQCNATNDIDLMLTTITVQAPVQKFEGDSFIQNHVYLLGVLVKNPSEWQTSQGVAKTKYQIALNRKDAIGGADYPFIASYGRLAKEDGMRLVQGSQLFIDGQLQTAKRIREVNCPTCGAVHTFNVVNTEVIARSTEYLNRCVFPENDDPNHWQMQSFQRLSNRVVGNS